MGVQNPMRQLLVQSREKRHLTQKQMAALIGVAKSTISKVEDGVRTPRRKLERWAKHYGFTLQKFTALIDWAADLPLFALMKTSQPEVCRTENGDAPKRDDVLRWARAYRLTTKRFKQMCAEAKEKRKKQEQWELPLWKFSECKSPAEIQGIVCRPHQSTPASTLAS